MGGDGLRPHRRGKGWEKSLLFLQPQIRISAVCFYASLSLSSPPRKMYKQTTDINICGRSDGRPMAVMVYFSLFMLLCLHFMLFCVSRRSRARDARVRTFSCVFVQYNTNQIRY